MLYFQMNKHIDCIQAWYKTNRTALSKLTKPKSGDGAPEHSEHDKWVLDKFGFIAKYINRQKATSKTMGGLPPVDQNVKRELQDLKETIEEEEESRVELYPTDEVYPLTQKSSSFGKHTLFILQLYMHKNLVKLANVQ